MKLLIHRSDGTPIEVESDHVSIMCGRDRFELREQGGLLVRIREHDGHPAQDLAVFPMVGNSVRLKGGL